MRLKETQIKDEWLFLAVAVILITLFFYLGYSKGVYDAKNKQFKEKIESKSRQVFCKVYPDKR